jgi:chromate transporter
MTSTATSPPLAAEPRLGALAGYFLRLGATGFGGPIALVGYMQRDLVERRGWFTQREYAEGLAFSQLAPGPLAAQLAMYLGWMRGGPWGATLVGTAFVLPSLAMVLGLSLAYVRFEGLAWMQGAFYGIGAAVVAIIARSVVKLARMGLGRDPALWSLFALNAAVVLLVRAELLWVFFASGLVMAVARRSPAVLPAAVPLDILWFFTKAGAVVFGSGLAIVPFLYGGAVQQFGWLNERQFLDAVAVSMITPGPVVITVAFIGYLVAGLPGALIAAFGVFFPVYFSVVAGAPFFTRLTSNTRVAAFVAGVTAAATGALAGAAVILGRRAIPDGPTLVIALVTLGLLLRARALPEAALMAAAGAVGVLLSGG